MKKIIFGAIALLSIASCTNDNAVQDNQDSTLDPVASAVTKRECPSEVIREQALASDPSLMSRYAEVERSTADFVSRSLTGRVLADGTVEIPVIVNVLYRTSTENISDAQIQSQIDVLNADYAAKNADVSKIPAEFQSVAAGATGISFKLAKINRKSTTVRSWNTNDAMKKASTKGIDATDPTHYLNFWVVGDMGGVLGYATFPESAGLWNDGVVVAAKYFGKTSAAPYNLGRTATHEVGHYLNLRHIWGDATCATDYVADTPTQQDKNFGTPSYPQMDVCGGVSRSIMFMNYMDYVDDAAMYMFSAGQKARMQAVTNAAGARAGLRVL